MTPIACLSEHFKVFLTTSTHKPNMSDSSEAIGAEDDAAPDSRDAGKPAETFFKESLLNLQNAAAAATSNNGLKPPVDFGNARMHLDGQCPRD